MKWKTYFRPFPKAGGLAFLSAILFVLSYPPFKTGFLSFVSLVPFFSGLKGQRSQAAFKIAYAAGLLCHLGLFYWLSMIHWSAMILLVLFLSLFWGITGMGVAWLYPRYPLLFYLGFPCYWILYEYCFSLTDLAFPWISLGYSLVYFPPLIQIAEWGGVYLVSLFIVLVNLGFFFIIEEWKNKKKVFLVAGLISLGLLVSIVYGFWVIPRARGSESLRVGLIQGNIDQDQKWENSFIDSVITIHENLSEKSLEKLPELLVWPETAAPCYLLRHPHYLVRMQAFNRRGNVPLLLGAVDFDYVEDSHPRYQYYNSSLYFKPASPEIEKYNKMMLVPFGERIPFVESIPFIKEILRNSEAYSPDEFKALQILKRLVSASANFKAGSEFKQFSVDGKIFPALICYEIIFPNFVRQFVKRGSDFLVNITNDGWYGKTSALYQHAAMAIMRAVENRIGVARAANTGISLLVNPAGEVIRQTEIGQTDFIVEDLPLRKKLTFYTKHGDWLVRFAGLGLLGVGIFLIVLNIRQSRGEIS